MSEDKRLLDKEDFEVFADVISKASYNELIELREKLDKEIRLSELAKAEGYE